MQPIGLLSQKEVAATLQERIAQLCAWFGAERRYCVSLFAIVDISAQNDAFNQERNPTLSMVRLF
jgi:hypothetical protein